jgi:beta-glucosidase
MSNINKLIQDLTLKEKISLLSGFNSWYTNKIDRLGIPSIKMSDGPNGVRGDSTSGKSSACFPCAISIGSSWDMNLINQLGIALGQEAKVKDVDVLLGPTINIHRHPLGGRHFECFSEDPFLTGKIATEYVKGVQSQEVAACLKHFIGNDTEYERHLVSSNIDEKTLREIYLLPFEMGIKDGDAKVVMSAYNKLNNIYCSSHKELLIDILKNEWGFDGYVVSDWGAALETEKNAIGGLDLEMPGPGNVWGDQLLTAVNEGKVQEELINDKVRRILNIAKFSKRFENPVNKPEESNNSEEHRNLLKKAAASGMVLLKNNDLLPLKKDIKNLAIIGPNAKEAQIIGGGSASLKPHYQAHPLEAFQNKLGDHTNISYAKGCHTHKYLPRIEEKFMGNKKGFLVEYFEGSNFGENLLMQEYLIGNKFWVFEGFAKEVIASIERPDISVRFSCAYTPDISGQHEFEIFGIGKARFLIDDKEIIDNWTETSPGEAFFSFSSDSKKAKVELVEGNTYQLEIQYKFEGNFPAIYIGCQAPDKVNLFDEALSVASAADQVILIVGTNSDWETEGNDRSDFNLPANQNYLIEEVLKKNSNTLIVLNTGSPVKMPWADKAQAIMQTWFAGQEFGNALVDVITGAINPSGRLPTSFPKNIEDTPAFNSYPGKELQMDYEEKLLVGYRWYDKKDIQTLFPFGHGLSYTDFNYTDLQVQIQSQNAVSCKFSIENIGEVYGVETAQCYVGFKINNDSEPKKTLQGFKKIELNSGNKSEVEIILDKRSFSSWNEADRNWEVRSGSYEILIGSSAEKILLQTTIGL